MRTILFVLTFVLISTNLCAQGFIDRSTYYSFGTKLYAEAFYQPVAESDSLEVTLLFKIAHHALVFVRGNSIELGNYFQADPALEATLRDSTGIIRHRLRWRDTLRLLTYDDTESKDLYMQGYLTFLARPGKYEAVISLLDSYERTAHKIDLSMEFKDFSSQPLISIPIFAEKAPGIRDFNYYPFILGGNVAFTSGNSQILFPISYKNEFDMFNFSIESQTKANGLFSTEATLISGRGELSPSDGLIIHQDPRNKQYYLNITRKTIDYSNLKFGILSINLPDLSMIPGKYLLKIYKDGSRDTNNFNFEVIWDDMPLSLRDLDYAIESVFYLLTDDEFKEMKRGSTEARKLKFVNFWKSKDPTPNTPFNESLLQYYKRIDYAFFNFQNTQTRDGSKTDKGKIYVLFGPPETVKKELKNGKSHDVWYYPRLAKIFYFESLPRGMFKLVKIDG